MLKVYGREDCPDCVACKASFDANEIEYDFRDIGKSLKDMAVFFKIRDLNKAFDNIKGTGKIGIPALIFEDQSATLDWEGYLAKEGYSVVAAGKSCSVDGTGC